MRDNSTLKLLQANCHRSNDTVMKHLFSESGVRECDIIAVQEPEIFTWMEPMGIHSQTLGGGFHALLRPTPTASGEDARKTQPRVAFFVNRRIDPKAWSIRHLSRDLSTLTLTTDAFTVHIHNIYLPGKFGAPDDDHAQRARDCSDGIAKLRYTISQTATGQHLVVGDFNLHHPLWSTNQRASVQDTDTDDLISAMGDSGIDLLTERGVTTFEGPVFGRTVRSTLDLTWASTPLANRLVGCAPQQQWWHGADHVPILTTVDVTAPKTEVRERRDWRATDWELWIKALERNCNWEPDDELISAEMVDTAVSQVMDAVEAALAETVPVHKQCSRSFPSYTAKLAPLKRRLKRARRHWQRTRDEAFHREFSELRHELCRQSKRAGRTAHRERVEEATQSIDSFWRLAKWARNQGVPQSSYTPTLRVGDSEFITTEEKARCFKTALFPPAPPADLSDIDQYSYPTAIKAPETISDGEIEHAIHHATLYNAPGPSGVPNAVWKRAI